jgi:hypothetical protein
MRVSSDVSSVYLTLVVALVLSRLDYCNATSIGLPSYLYWVVDAAARSFARLRRSDHFEDILNHFSLRVPELTYSELLKIVHRSLHDAAHWVPVRRFVLTAVWQTRQQEVRLLRLVTLG